MLFSDDVNSAHVMFIGSNGAISRSDIYHVDEGQDSNSENDDDDD